MTAPARRPFAGTIFSRPFRLLEQWGFNTTLSPDEGLWRTAPLLPPDGVSAPLRRRWVYVFSVGEGDTYPTLWAEICCDAKGKLAIVDGARRLRTAAPDGVSAEPLGGAEFVVPHTANGRRLYHFFIAARFRLVPASLRRLMRELPFTAGGTSRSLVAPVDLADDATFLQDEDGTPALLVVNPETIAYNLKEEYDRALWERRHYETGEDGTPTEVERAGHRALAHALALVLDQFIERQPSLRGCLASGQRGDVRGFVNARARVLQELQEIAEKRATALVRFLGSRLMAQAELWHRDQEKERYHGWLELLGHCYFGLGQTKVGGEFLEKVTSRPSYVLQKYLGLTPDLSPTGKPLQDATQTSVVPRFEAGRKAVTGCLQLWSETAPWLLRRAPQRAEAHLALEFVTQGLNSVLGDQIVRVTTVTQHGRKLSGLTIRPGAEEMVDFWKKELAAFDSKSWLGKKVDALAARIEPYKKQSLLAPTSDEWAKGTRHARAVVGLEALLVGLHAVNLVIAARQFAGERYRVVDDYIGLGAGVLDASEGVLALLSRLGAAAGAQVSLRVLGTVAGVAGAYQATGLLQEGWARNDTGYWLAQASIGIGEAGMAVGGLVSLAAMLPAAGPGLAAASAFLPPLLGISIALVAIGAIAAALTEDTRLETFVRHCYFGCESGGKVPWLPLGFDAWKEEGSLLQQIEALYSLIGKFELKAVDQTSVRITLGATLPRVRIAVAFEIEFLGESEPVRATLVVDPHDLKAYRFIGMAISPRTPSKGGEPEGDPQNAIENTTCVIKPSDELGSPSLILGILPKRRLEVMRSRCWVTVAQSLDGVHCVTIPMPLAGRGKPCKSFKDFPLADRALTDFEGDGYVIYPLKAGPSKTVNFDVRDSSFDYERLWKNRPEG